MGTGADMSARISARTRSCAAVRPKGSCFDERVQLFVGNWQRHALLKCGTLFFKGQHGLEQKEFIKHNAAMIA